MKVSIIIPVYNVENYISRCIESVLLQTYTNTEVILVDDGSNDESGWICDRYASNDERIKVVHKKNGGLSSARNTGIDIATGDAFFFLDSDDFISIECIDKLVHLMQDKNADVAIIRMKYIHECQNKESPEQETEKIVEMSSQNAIEESLYQKLYSCCTPAKLYKRDVVENIKFPLGKLSEDLATCHLFLDRARRVVYSSYEGYFYRQHTTSIMHNFTPNRMDALVWAKDIEKFCKEKYPDIVNAAVCRTFNVSVHLLLDIPERGEEHDNYYKVIWPEIKRTRIRTIFTYKARKREKAAAILSFAGEKILKMVWNSKVHY